MRLHEEPDNVVGADGAEIPKGYGAGSIISIRQYD